MAYLLVSNFRSSAFAMPESMSRNSASSHFLSPKFIAVARIGVYRPSRMDRDLWRGPISTDISATDPRNISDRSGGDE